MRALFFGTPEFAVPILAALVESGIPPLQVITQPARPVGRGRRLRDPPVAAWAREHGLEVLQPDKVRGQEILSRWRELAPDAAVVVAFGQIFRRRLLELPRLGCINLHASLLPYYRGAAPIQAAIAAGETRTGVTTMRMQRGLDSGPILLQQEVDIQPDETTAELAPRLASVGAELMVRTLRELDAGTLEPQPQRHQQATYAPMLTKSDGAVDWRLPASRIHDRLRAYTPWPGLTAQIRGQSVKILRGRAASVSGAAGDRPAGQILDADGDGMRVACGDGTIFVLERAQLAGRKPISALDLMNGLRLEADERFAIGEE
ncbi:MAG: methionyl-tRNA formyltransferase [Thermoanaerobaculia bacterium]